MCFQVARYSVSFKKTNYATESDFFALAFRSYDFFVGVWTD